METRKNLGMTLTTEAGNDFHKKDNLREEIEKTNLSVGLLLDQPEFDSRLGTP
jgi:hypothetical protein